MSLGFFTDIFVPHTQLAQPSEWDDARQSWVYFSGGDDEEAEVLKHDYDEGQRIRFKVTKVAFQFAQANAAADNKQKGGSRVYGTRYSCT